MSSDRTMHIAGVPVKFPHLPYRAQSALMHATITSIRTKRNALIESPTGTGKSLALLCASLAYQQHALKTQHDPSKALTQALAPHPTPSSPPPPLPTPVPSGPSPTRSKPLDSDDDDFEPPKKFRDVSWQLPKEKRPAPVEEPENAFMLQGGLFSFSRERMLDSQMDDAHRIPQAEEETQNSGKRIPRIFYATRTHKQVAHVIGELRKTAYRPRICVLASRREYCIRDDVREAVGRDELCKGIVKAGECEFFYKAQELGESSELVGEAWDIEELVEVGKRMGGCAYYASHELYQNAQLVLCPYSFLVDPIVRGARGINLSGDVVILDEAHNIEGYCRDSVGFEAEVADMRRACDEVDTMILTGAFVGGDLALAYRRLKGVLECLMSLVDAAVAGNELKPHDRLESVCYEGEDLLRRLEAVDVTEEEVKRWRASYEMIINYGDGNESKRMKRMGEGACEGDGSAIDACREKGACDTPKSEEALEKCSNSTNAPGAKQTGGFEYGYGCVAAGSDGLHMGNGQAGESGVKSRPRRMGRVGRGRGKGGRGRRRGAGMEEAEGKPWVGKCMRMTHGALTTLEYLFANAADFSGVVERKTVDFVSGVTVKIICLNAGVCFQDVAKKARSVIVTSGTLRPLQSFAGELGVSFEISKSLPHIIDVRKQLYVGVVAEGPGREVFDATFSGCAKFSFQDSLGQALLDYCEIIPQGVLVFFPSYRMMNQMHMRWKSCGVWDGLNRMKGAVMVEPNQRGEVFDQIVKDYEKAAESERGALLFGVCRGKLSEGVDFKDATARGVILVGIPFPYVGDVVVQQKRMYNDRRRNEEKDCRLQSGGEWYQVQAFRALNQALGRVIRHRYDYGAILLVDRRFREERVVKRLSKWAVDGLQERRDGRHESLLLGLQDFYKRVQEDVAKCADQERSI